MKGGRGSNGAATDLLVCFPSRAHLALMPPKAISCSPSRPSASSEPGKRRHSTSRAGPPPPSSAALFKAAASRNPSRRHAEDLPVDDEPSSPKVTCAGQIKSRRPTAAAKPKIADAKAKKATWLQALGIKKVDALPFLMNAVHGAFRLNVTGCFGSFPGGAVGEYTSGEDDDDDDEDNELVAKDADTEHGAALAKWFMVLEEGKKVSSKKRQQEPAEKQEEDVAPPANALMLMRCRSAPAKGIPRRLGGDAEEQVTIKSAKKGEEEEEEEENKEQVVLMSYAPDFFKVSVDIAKETWIVGGDDAVLRCRSWKR